MTNLSPLYMMSLSNIMGTFQPSESDIKNLKEWCSFGEGENKKLDRGFLRSITGMQHGKGMPSKDGLKNLKNKWIENKDH